MGVSASALALSRPFVFGDMKLNIVPLTYEACARFTLWIEERSLLAMERASQISGEKTAWRSAHLENVASGKYEIGSQIFSDTSNSDSGFRKIAELMIDHPDAEELSWKINEDDVTMNALRKLCGDINSNPLAVRLRRMPTLKPKEE